MFFSRVSQALAEVADRYDVVILDCPPQLGFLTPLRAVRVDSAARDRPSEMLDIMSMCQFLLMTSELLGVVAKAGGDMQLRLDALPGDAVRADRRPQTQMVAFMRSLFGERVLTNAMLKSTAISDASITKQTLYEVTREQFTRSNV